MSGDTDDACVCATGIDRRRRETAERGVIFLCLLWNVLLRGRVLRWPNNSVRRNKERKLTACLVLITTAMDRAFYTDMAQTMEPDTFQRIIAGKGSWEWERRKSMLLPTPGTAVHEDELITT